MLLTKSCTYYIAVLLLGLSASLTLSAQKTTRQFESGDYTLEISQWTKEEGLPSWHIYDFIEDKRGYTWLASSEGLIRFDGRNFKRYSDERAGFRSQIIGRLAADVNGNIWLFAFLDDNQRVIDVFDPLEEKAIPGEKYTGTKLPLSTIAHHGFFRQQDTIWILDPASGQGGRYTGKWEWLLNDTTINGDVSLTNYPLYFPRKDQLFWRWENNTKNASLQLIDKYGNERAYPSFHRKNGSFSALDTALNFYYWQPSPHSFKVDTLFELGETVRAFPPGEYPAISWGNTMRNGQYRYIETNQHGFGLSVRPNTCFFFRGKETIFSDLSSILAQTFGTRIYETVFLSKDGTFWFISPAGLFRMRVKKKEFSIYKPEDNTIISVRAMVGLGDSQLIANTYSGVFQIQLADKSFTPLAVPDPFENLSLLKEDNVLWFGKVADNLLRYDLAKQTYQAFPFTGNANEYNAYDFHRINDTVIWIASSVGVLQFNEQTKLFTSYCLQDTSVYYFHENQQGLWLGMRDGLVLFGENLKIKQRFPVLEADTKDERERVYYIYEDQEGYFWLGSSQGLIRWRPDTRKYEHFTVEDGLSDNNIHAIFEDHNDNLWLSSDYGLMRFRKSDGYVTTYLEKDGLPSNEFNFLANYQRADGTIFLGGVNGIISFHPDSIQYLKAEHINLQVAEIIAYDRKKETSVNLTRQGVEDGVLIIQANNNRLEVSIVPHHLVNNKLIYEWRLPKESQAWKVMAEPRLFLSNLSYGTYPLEFRAYPLGNKHQTSTILALELQVLKPVHLRRWFIVLCILSLFFAIFCVVQWRQMKLKQRNRKLQEEVERRTLELQDKLAIIRRQTQELKLMDEMKSRFFTNISHELRTPLSLIMGPVTDMLESAKLSEEQRAKLERIRRNTRQLNRLTEEVLDLARLEAGKLEVYRESILLSSFVKRLFGTYMSLTEYRGLKYDLELDLLAELPYAKLDVPKVERILNNLLSNAIKFSQAGDQIMVKVKQFVDRIQVSVEDTGMGIAAADLPHIFDRYYQAHHGKMNDGGGLGVGLAMSKELAELMEGRLYATSQLGKGTTLTLDLPASSSDSGVKSTRQTAMVSSSASVVTSSTVQPYRKENRAQLLVVEDNEDFLDYLSETLAAQFSLIQARNGREALRLLEQSHIDLIISDAMMPAMGGFELLQSIRSLPAYEVLPFILLTAKAQPADQLKALRLGVDAYLTKPFEAVELLARINNLLQNQQQRRAAFSQLQTKQGLASDMTVEETPDPAPFQEEWIERLTTFIEAHYADPELKVTSLAQHMQISERSLRTKLKLFSGLTPGHYILQFRLEKALLFLEHNRYSTVSEVCYATGFNSTSYFAKVFKNEYGKSPSEYL